MAGRFRFIIIAPVLALLCSCGSRKVEIGIAWRYGDNPAYYTKIINAIREAGGTPVILGQVKPEAFEYEGTKLPDSYTDGQGVLLQPFADRVKALPADSSNVAEAVGRVRAVVFTGGEDISPTLYRNPEPWHGLEDEGAYDAARDVSEYLTLAYCLGEDIPTLCICRGMQMLSVVSGADMIQDIPEYIENCTGNSYGYLHRQAKFPGVKRDYAPHDVIVTDRESVFYRICGCDTLRAVPSWHHQCVESVEGTPLKVSGVTLTQGVEIIEAVERPDRTFCIGVQFHPEGAIDKCLNGDPYASDYMDMDAALSYFRELVKEAKKR